MRIQFIGDLMLGRGVQTSIDMFGPHKVFADVLPLIDKPSYLIANLESPMCSSDTEHLKKDPHLTFHIDPQNVEILKLLNVTGVTLANNHITDCGKLGLTETIQILDSAGIKHTGAGLNLKQASAPICLSDECDTVQIISCNLYSPFVKSAGKHSFGCLMLGKDSVINAIEPVLDNNKPTILCLHWGIDYHKYPVPAQLTYIKKLLDCHPNVLAVIGHHPHLVQPILTHKNTPIVCSLGNFIFDEPFHDSRIGAIVEVHVQNAQIQNIEMSYVHLDRNNNLMPLSHPNAQVLEAQLEGIKKGIEGSTRKYVDLDKKWYKILLADIIYKHSCSSFKQMLLIYSPRKILFYSVYLVYLFIVRSIPRKQHV